MNTLHSLHARGRTPIAFGALSLLSMLPVHAATTAYHTAVLADNPYLHYRLGESSGVTTADASANGRTGTYFGSPALGQPGAAAVGDTAVGFDGTDDYVSISNSTGFGSSMGTSSYEFVFSTTTTDRVRLFGTYNTGTTTAIDIVLNENAVGNEALADAVRLYIRDESGSAQDIGATFTNVNLFDGGFHHLVVTYDATGGADRLSAYVDGVGQSISYGTNLDGTPVNFVNFGFDPALAARNVRGTVGSFFPGTIDEFALYDSVLSESQVAAHAALVPEPSVALLGGLSILGLIRRRR